MFVAATGWMAGLFHVLSGPDHLAAVAPLALDAPDRPWREGWGWGLGHTAGVLGVAGAALLLRDRLPPVDDLSAWSERVVGAALIGIGVWSVGRALAIGASGHQHATLSHAHTHVRRGPSWIRRLGHPHASFLMGVLHGMAGSAHIVGIVPALALPSTSAAVAYLAAFGAGSIAAMAGFAACVGHFKARGVARLQRRLLTVSGAAAMAIGAIWVWG
jgi:hypothetical protein